MLATNANGLALEVGHLSPTMCSDPLLDTGEIGYIITNLKTTREARVGDTVTLRKYFVQLVLIHMIICYDCSEKIRQIICGSVLYESCFWLIRWCVGYCASAGWIRVVWRLFVFGGQIIASVHI